MKTPAAILSKATGGRSRNNIIDIIQTNESPTEGDQLSLFVERNRSLIKEFVLIICGFLIFIMIVLFFVFLVIVLLNQEKIIVQKKEYESVLLKNYDIRNRNITKID